MGDMKTDSFIMQLLLSDRCLGKVSTFHVSMTGRIRFVNTRHFCRRLIEWAK
ncbi:hypothetical protein [Novosphingobium lindaniclasticum]|uniref:Uncharacterized protein n=1 Tax=Novosphingobium lindaniclasticum LE124 TaxID=1096930 RepID=T0HDB3_9SPHN|nr:hypothetical protein [Novosphingobium lindaniclasticum]EQB14306.1 hypothetical protein L284_12995 [Novosphingobium lindaniclasticum LE124]